MNIERRSFLLQAGGLAAAAAVIGAPLSRVAQAQDAPAPATGVHVLPPLPYATDALEPYIDAETMTLHHGKHHAAYVKGLNEAEKALADARLSGNFEYVQHWSRKAAFNGGGHFLHAMFWKVMAPHGKGGGGAPDGPVAALINRDFGSFDAFRAHFSAAAAGVEGSGWALLHYRLSDGSLHVLQAENQHKLTAWDSVPVLGIDVWEHAYYVTYRNNRSEYISQWWNVVNWDQVNANIAALRGPA
jgi:superoxide dismutase, Fe-Mn family